eukprot:1014892_1
MISRKTLNVDLTTKTVLDLLEEDNSLKKLHFGCPILDEFLDGGLQMGITEIVGEAGVGKTQCVLQFLLQVQLPMEHGGLDGDAAYVCTEGDFPLVRLNQLISASRKKYPNIDARTFRDRIHVQEIPDATGLITMVDRFLELLLKRKPIRLVVIDSIAAPFRTHMGGANSRARELFQLAGKLKRLSREFRVPIVVVNQVVDVFDSDTTFQRSFIGSFISSDRRVKPALGLSWSHCVNTRIFLTRARFNGHCSEGNENNDESNSRNYSRFEAYLASNSRESEVSPKCSQSSLEDSIYTQIPAIPFTQSLEKPTSQSESTPEGSKVLSSPVRHMHVALSPCLPFSTVQFTIDSNGVR